LYNSSELKDEKSEHHDQNYWFIFFGIKIPFMTLCIGIAFFCYTRKKLKKETSSKLYFIIELIRVSYFYCYQSIEEIGLSFNADVVESLV
jgi:hypothetical protein